MRVRIGTLLSTVFALGSCAVSRELHNIEPISLTSAAVGGAVVDSVTGQPIIGAELTLLSAAGDSAGRDQQSKTFSFAPRGEFRFDEVRPCSYVLRASAAGYRT